LSQFDLKLCNLLPHMRDPGKDVAWRQLQRQLVRVAENDCVVGRQVERISARPARTTAESSAITIRIERSSFGQA
jgi:hypothetical protein